ncbi:putative glycolipid-binding domain-containing protein [Brevibacterium sp. GP-SGM9]|uniref:putative glycolipid-binding domain-containing protein n=1 Tax=Brevibacterium sp. GP-SGM9 TaxID=3376990 RepID=UPI0039A784FC
MDDEFNGTSLELVGVFHWQERISFFQSPCLYYPRGDSDLPAPGVAADADLGGAVDCDLGRCPLTNVMPIRRLGLLRKEVPDPPLVMAWIDVPSLRVIRSDQVYGSSPTAGKVRYTSYSRDFSAEITVDSHGIVIDYPELALRSDFNSN